jgi:hypothetical protein
LPTLRFGVSRMHDLILCEEGNCFRPVSRRDIRKVHGHSIYSDVAELLHHLPGPLPSGLCQWTLAYVLPCVSAD